MKKLIMIGLFFVFMAKSLCLAETAKPPLQEIQITVTDQGFEPKTVNVKPDMPVILNVTRESELTCAKEIVIPEKKIDKKLPLHKTVKISLGKLSKGEIRFGCGMNMMEAGQIHVQ